jgi:hypothetical protein
MEIVSSGATLRKRIFSICGGPNSVGSPYNQPRLARSRISLCATTDRNDRLAIRPNDQTKPAWGAGFCLLGWRGWRALPLQALTQFVNIHIRDAFLGTSRCGRERRYARQFRRLLVTHPRSAHSQSFARTRLRSAPITLSLRACRRPEAAPLSFRRFPWLASPESRVISRMRLFA